MSRSLLRLVVSLSLQVFKFAIVVTRMLFAIGIGAALHVSAAGIRPFMARASIPAALIAIGAASVWLATAMAILFFAAGPDVLGPAVVILGPATIVLAIQLNRWARPFAYAYRRGTQIVGTTPPRMFMPSRPYTVSITDRLQHVAVTGATGSGKSSLVANLVVADIVRGAGVIVIDPKDSLVDEISRHAPAHRIDDIILWDATDTALPFGFNPLAGVSPERRTLATAELVAVLRRLFPDSWGPRLQHILTNVVLALTEVPGATLLDIQRLLLDPGYRANVVGEFLTNPGVRQFMVQEFEPMLARRSDALTPILNKVGMFGAYPELRNCIGQQTSSFDLRNVMDSSRVLLVRLPQGSLGEDVASLLAGLLVAKIQLAAHSRVDTPPDRRRPVWLYCDEFQTYVTSSFERILAESRAFGLGLICANQYAEQLSGPVRLAVAHNAATAVHCRVERGHHLLELMPLERTEQDLPPIRLEPPPPLPPGDPARAAQIREHSRKLYGRPRAEVEELLSQRGSGTALPPRKSPNGVPVGSRSPGADIYEE